MSLYHCSLGPHGEVDCLGMMHNNGGGGLLRHELVSLGEIDANCIPGGEQLEHLRVVLQVVNSLEAPAIAASPLLFQFQVAANNALHILCQRLSHLDGQSMH